MIKKLCLLLFSGMAVSSFVNAQQYSGKQADNLLPEAETIIFSNSNNVPSCIVFKQEKIKETTFFSAVSKLFKLQFADSWKKTRTDNDELKMKHHRYQQYYNGVKVEQGEYILHEKNNFLVSANGSFFDGLSLKTIPAITESDALKSALKDVNAKRYKWEIQMEEDLLKRNEQNATATFYPKAELVISSANETGRKPVFKLAYKFDVYADEPMSRQYIYIDAISGTVIKKENRICEFIANGTAVTKYSGTKSIITDSLAPGSYRLRDLSRGGNVETYNMNSGTSYGAAVDFTDTDNLWNTIANQDDAAYDAHYGAQMTYDYYLSVHNRNSYNNLGSPLRSYVHFSSNYNNAFWNGSQMSYGDGNGVAFSPLTTLDVCGHELTHGVTGNSSALVYSYESGALNESFSDIFGTCVDFFANPSGANFLVGEQCYTPGTSGDALRSMSNPNAEGDPDTYLGTNWYAGAADNGGVHTNSGVQNFWFYLLCLGGSGINDIGFNYNVAAIGINDARLIAYRNNNFYLTSGSQYSDARNYSIMAAGDIFGPCSPQQVSVKNAWDAVGVIGNYNPLPNITMSNNSPLCPGSALNLSATGGVSYSWTGPGGYSSVLQNPTIQNIPASQAGIYTVVVTDANGCSGTKTSNVYLHLQPAVTSSSNVTVCAGDSVPLTSAGLAFGVGGSPVSTLSTSIVNIPDNNLTGILSPITVSNQGNANQLISITIDSLVHTWTGDLNFYLVAPNLSQIALAIGVGNSGDNFLHTTLSAAATNVIGSINNNSAPFTGTYAPQTPFSGLTGTANGIWKLKIVDAFSQDIGTLYGWTITLSGPNGISSYSWSPVNGLNSAVIQNPEAVTDTTITYNVTVTDYIGCTATSSTMLNVNLVTLNPVINNVSCNGIATGQVNLTVSGLSGPYQYYWSNGSSTEDIGFLGVGTYTVTVTDVNGCTETVSASITEPAVISVNGISSQPLCAGNLDGSIDLSVNGGVLPYSYQWSNGYSTEDINNLGAGTFNVTISDANGCISYGSYIIAAPAGINISSIQQGVSCFGGSNGAININLSGGVSPYNYNWSTGSSNEDISGLVSGNYQVTVTDGNGCLMNSTFLVNQPAPVNLAAAVSNPPCSQPSGGQIDITVTGGTGGYAFLWSDGSSTEDLINIPGGTYLVTVTDANGCVNSLQVILVAVSSLSVTPVINHVACYGQASGGIQLSLNGGTSPFSFLWSGGSTVQNRTGLPAGLYTVSISDNSGCSALQTYTVTQPSALLMSTVKTDLKCRGGNDGAIDLSVTGGTPGYTFLWSNGASTEDISNLIKNTYTVTVTDANGCKSTKITTLTQPSASITINSSKTNTRCYGAQTGVISLSVTGGVAPYTYSWNTVPVKTSASISGLAAGVYTCSVTDALGCIKGTSVQITQPASIVILSTQTNVSIPGGNNGIASVSVSGGTGPYTFSWNTFPVRTTATITGLNSGIYTVKITDSKSCTKTASIIITEPGPRSGISYNQKKFADLSVYPNPNNGNIMAEVESAVEEISQFSVFDYSGRLVFMQHVLILPGVNHQNFDLTCLPKGLYLLQFISSTNKKEIKMVLH